MIKRLKRLFLVMISTSILSMITYSHCYAKYQGDVMALNAWLSGYIVQELEKDKTYKNIDEFIDAVCDIPVKDGFKSKGEVKPYRDAAKAYFKYKAAEEGVSTKDIKKINNGDAHAVSQGFMEKWQW